MNLTTRKTLLILSFDYPPSIGGIARLCNEITHGLAKKYKKVIVITTTSLSETEQPKDQTVEIVRIHGKRIILELKIIATLKKFKNKNDIDVLCGLWHPEALLAILGGMKRIFVLGHGAEFLSGNSKVKKMFWLPIYCRYILGRIDQIITNSNYTKNLVLSINPKAHAKALPLAVNHKFFRPLNLQRDTDKIILSTVSRILKFKGHLTILNALEQIPENLREKIIWKIAGTGPHLEWLRENVEASIISDQVEFVGFIKDEKLPDFYNSSDLFIMATEEQKSSNQVEGFGLVFLETQSCGTPAIGTNTGGIPDAIEHLNGGWLFEQKDYKSLSNLVQNLLLSPNQIKEQGENARKRIIEGFTWEIYCTKLFQILSA